jgi:hypothetical protein
MAEAIMQRGKVGKGVEIAVVHCVGGVPGGVAPVFLTSDAARHQRQTDHAVWDD